MGYFAPICTLIMLGQTEHIYDNHYNFGSSAIFWVLLSYSELFVH